jgi:antitoxin (DNA-binding transcriptional repressor) of toxin-antitoxin stability system
MQANIVDLRYKMKDVLEALDRQEDVEILYHGKAKGKITAINKPTDKKVSEDPFFGMRKDFDSTVEEEMNQLRAPRYRDL